MEKPLKIGVLAVQGNFREHAAVLRRLGADPVEVRLPGNPAVRPEAALPTYLRAPDARPLR